MPQPANRFPELPICFTKGKLDLVLLVIETGRLQPEVRFDAVQTHEKQSSSFPIFMVR